MRLRSEFVIHALLPAVLASLVLFAGPLHVQALRSARHWYDLAIEARKNGDDVCELVYLTAYAKSNPQGMDDPSIWGYVNMRVTILRAKLSRDPGILRQCTEIDASDRQLSAAIRGAEEVLEFGCTSVGGEIEPTPENSIPANPDLSRSFSDGEEPGDLEDRRIEVFEGWLLAIVEDMPPETLEGLQDDRLNRLLSTGPDSTMPASLADLLFDAGNGLFAENLDGTAAVRLQETLLESLDQEWFDGLENTWCPGGVVEGGDQILATLQNVDWHSIPAISAYLSDVWPSQSLEPPLTETWTEVREGQQHEFIIANEGFSQIQVAAHLNAEPQGDVCFKVATEDAIKARQAGVEVKSIGRGTENQYEAAHLFWLGDMQQNQRLHVIVEKCDPGPGVAYYSFNVGGEEVLVSQLR